MSTALKLVTVAVGNLDECETAVGTRDPDRAADASGARPAGRRREAGSEGRARPDGRQRRAVPPVLVDVVNGLGAGDAFGGSLCHGLLSGWPLERTLHFANAAGAIVAGRLACADAMPTVAEVDAFLSGEPLPAPPSQEQP